MVIDFSPETGSSSGLKNWYCDCGLLVSHGRRFKASIKACLVKLDRRQSVVVLRQKVFSSFSGKDANGLHYISRNCVTIKSSLKMRIKLFFHSLGNEVNEMV